MNIAPFEHQRLYHERIFAVFRAHSCDTDPQTQLHLVCLLKPGFGSQVDLAHALT